MTDATTTFLLPERPIRTLAEYLDQRDGGAALARARTLGPEGVIDELQASGLRGRGGAGFPAGRKWASVRAGRGRGSVTVLANGAEGEPGTFKDRQLMSTNPYQVLEGLLVAAEAVGARAAYIGLKASFVEPRVALERAIRDFDGAGLLSVPVQLVAGPEEYLFGEETGLLEVAEGGEPLPRVLPPYMVGLGASVPASGWSSTRVAPGPDERSNPTLATNVETLANVPPILARGADWYRSLGTADSPGVVLCTIVGDTVKAGVAEVELGTPLAEVIERIGHGMPAGRHVRAVLSGVANPVLTGPQLDTPLSYEGMRAAGSGLGACGFLVYDDRRDMVAVALMVSRFLAVESCGQCPPCKLGSMTITGSLERIAANEGTDEDLETIAGALRTVTDANRCYLGTQEQQVVSSMLRAFPEDFADHLEGRRPPAERLPVPKLVALEDGVAVYDADEGRKRPDWTYADTELDRVAS